MKLKNKKGFTLIELLAVIVVLAIIALIATPIVMNTIKNAKKGAAERTADNYIKQVETAVAEAKLENKSVPNGTYDIDKDGNLTGAGLPNGNLEIDMSGNKPTSGKVTIKNGGVSQDGTSMTLGDYNVKYKDDKLTASELYKGVLCKANMTKVTALVHNQGNYADESSYTREEVGLLASEATSKYDTGVTYTCELGDGEENTFYVLETNGNNVSLIAGMNLGTTVAWVTKEDYLAADGTEIDWNKVCVGCGNNNLGPITANKELKKRTSSWTKLDEDQITLPTGQQIAIAGGDTKWNTGTYGDGFSSAKWLYSYTKFTTGTYGYWTSSPHTSRAYYAWIVECAGNLSKGSFNRNDIRSSSDYGIRPVITVLKSNLN